MLLKALLFLVLFYFVVRTAARLIRAMKGEGEPSRLDREPSAGWNGSNGRPSYDDEDVEDAKFVDVS